MAALRHAWRKIQDIYGDIAGIIQSMSKRTEMPRGAGTEPESSILIYKPS